MSYLEYTVLNKRISETEQMIEDSKKITDDLMRELTLSEISRQLQHLYDKRRKLEDATAKEEVSLRLYGENVETGRISTRILAAALDGFQNIADSIANSIVHIPTLKGKIPQSILDLTDFQVVGVFPGSFGVKLEKANDQLDATSDMSQLTSILNEFFNVLESADQDDLLLNSIVPYGKRTIRNYREWLQTLHDHNVNVDICWNDSLACERRVHVMADKAPNIIRILNTIETTDDTETVLTGTLTGINVRNLTFELLVEDVGLIKGKSKLETLISLTNMIGKEITAHLIETISTTKGNVQKISWYLYNV